MRFTEDFGLKVEEIKMEDAVIESDRPPRIEVREREEGDIHEDEREREKRQKVECAAAAAGGGLLDNLLSKLASPRTPKSSEDQAFEVNNHSGHDDARVQGSDDGDSGGDKDGGGGGGGGVINNLISNFFHRNSEGECEGEGEGEEVKNNGSEERLECSNEDSELNNKAEKQNEGGHSNGGSLIATLVQDVAAPEIDEASILIHSVVHD